MKYTDINATTTVNVCLSVGTILLVNAFSILKESLYFWVCYIAKLFKWTGFIHFIIGPWYF